MHAHYRSKHKEEQSLEAVAKLQQLLRVLEYLTLLLNNFNKSYKPRELNQFVHPAKPCDTRDPIYIVPRTTILLRYKRLKRKDGHKVEQKPATQVLLRYQAQVVDEHKVVVIERSDEYDNHVKREKNIYSIVENCHAKSFFLKKCQRNWSNRASNDKNKCNEEVPVNFESVLRIQHVPFPVRPGPHPVEPLLSLPLKTEKIRHIVINLRHILLKLRLAI